MPKGIKGFQKNNPGRPAGSKNKTTLLKEERRAIFDEKISQKWEKIIDKLKPEYVSDQFMGKAEEKIIVTLPKPITDIFKAHDNNNSNKEDSEVIKEN